MKSMKATLILAGLALMLPGCEGWQSVAIPMPGDAPTIAYQRKSFSQIRFVGTEHRRRLRVGDSSWVDLPVQPSLSDLDNVYLTDGPLGYQLYFEEEFVGALVDLHTLQMSEQRLDSLGTFLGIVGGRDELRFIPASDGPPDSFGR